MTNSSYERNNYAEVFFAIVTAFRPVNAVELGVLHGYSALAIARGLKRNSVVPGVKAKLDAYDLFENYPYNHGNQQEVQERLKETDLEDFVTLYKDDAFKVHEKYTDNSVYFLHIDLSNTGEIIKKTIEVWDKKMVIGGIILFEGGSEERDKVDWMIKYNKMPIKQEIETNKIINTKYVYGTYLKFPSLTLLLKKRAKDLYS